MTDREAAWNAVHEALPAGWTVGPPTYDPGVPGWSVTARSVAYSRLSRSAAQAWTRWRPCATWTIVFGACRSRTDREWRNGSGA